MPCRRSASASPGRRSPPDRRSRSAAAQDRSPARSPASTASLVLSPSIGVDVRRHSLPYLTAGAACVSFMLGSLRVANGWKMKLRSRGICELYSASAPADRFVGLTAGAGVTALNQRCSTKRIRLVALGGIVGVSGSFMSLNRATSRRTVMYMAAALSGFATKTSRTACRVNVSLDHSSRASAFSCLSTSQREGACGPRFNRCAVSRPVRGRPTFGTSHRPYPLTISNPRLAVPSVHAAR